MKSLRARRSGVTIIELLLALGMMAAVITVLSLIFQQSYKTYALETVRGELQLQARSATDRIGRELRQASTVVASYSTYTTSSSVLVLQIASVDGLQQIIPSTYDYFIYQLDPSDASKLQEIVVANASSNRPSNTRTILSNVTSLNFSYYDTNQVLLASNYQDAKRVVTAVDLSKTRYGKAYSVTYKAHGALINK